MIFASIEQIWLEIEKAIAKINPPVVRKALAMVYLDGVEVVFAASVLRLSVEELREALVQGVEILSKNIDVPIDQIINLVANFGEETDIKKTWDLATISMDEYLQEQFYECLKTA